MRTFFSSRPAPHNPSGSSNQKGLLCQIKYRTLLWVTLALLPVIAADGQVRPIWQIGKFDESPVEFFSRRKGFS